MFTVKRIIDGDRISSEHNKVRLGDRNSRVFKDAMRLLNKDGAVFDADAQTAASICQVSIEPCLPDRQDPNTQKMSHYLSFIERYLVDEESGLQYLASLFPTTLKSVMRDQLLLVSTDPIYSNDDRTLPYLIILKAGKPYPASWRDNHEGYTTHVPCEGSDLIALYHNPSVQSFEGVIGDTSTCHEVFEVRLTVDFTIAPAIESVVKGVRPGTRTPDELIGVMIIEEDAGFDEATNIAQSGVYELFYRGDEVYVTNSHGKTTDALR